jgi:hypothetical protein
VPVAEVKTIFYSFMIILILDVVASAIGFFVFKRKDVSIYDAMFTFPATHGALWHFEKPEVYYEKRFLPYVKYILPYSAIISFCAMTLVLIVTKGGV